MRQQGQKYGLPPRQLLHGTQALKTSSTWNIIAEAATETAHKNASMLTCQAKQPPASKKDDDFVSFRKSNNLPRLNKKWSNSVTDNLPKAATSLTR
eukprot:3052766-Amphidinium_carterae.1